MKIKSKIFFNYLFKIFLIFIFFTIFNLKGFKCNVFIRENNKNYEIKENELSFIKSGEYFIEAKKENLSVIIKNDNIKLYFNNCEIYLNYKSLIIIDSNIKNINIIFNNCEIYNNFNIPFLKINDNSNVIIFVNYSIINGGIIFFNENNYNNIFLDGYFKINKKIYHKKGIINIIKNYSIVYENYKLKIESLIFQIHPFLINIDIKKNIYKKIFFEKSNNIFNNDFRILKNFVNNFINLKEKVIITMTSWKKRINYINSVLEILLNNTYIPDKVILNLAIEEFPKKNDELPKNILNLLRFNNFEIFWVEKNNNVFKKLIPTINRFKNDLIITTDDDILYSYDFIENILKMYIKNGANKPMSFGTHKSDWIIGKIKINSHYGRASIVKYEYFNEKLNELYKETTENLINNGIKCYDDILYTYAAILNGYKYLRVNEYNIYKYIKKSFPLKYPFSKRNDKNINRYHRLIRKYIKQKYNKTIENFIKLIK
jgi:hypothetical protein